MVLFNGELSEAARCGKMGTTARSNGAGLVICNAQSQQLVFPSDGRSKAIRGTESRAANIWFTGFISLKLAASLRQC